MHSGTTGLASQTIRSRSRRSSQESRRSSTDLTSNTKSEQFTIKQSTTIAAIIREENNDTSIVYAIREELLNNVLNECIRRDIERDCVKYMVRCAYKAMKRIVELHFLVHDFGKDDFEKSSAWQPDEKPVPSPPDTWAAYNVPVVSSLEEELKEEKVTEKEVPITQHFSNATVDVSSKAVTEQSISTPPASITDIIEQYLVVPHSSEVEFEEYPEDEEDYYVKKEKSVFTTLMTCDTESNPFAQYSSSLKWKDTQSKLTKTAKMNLEKKLSKGVESKISITSLPPLRAEAQLKIMNFSGKESKEKKEKQ